MNRVVVTGMGAITPLGNDVSSFWNNLINGKCGISQITKFDTEQYKVKIAAEVHDFDPLLYMDRLDIPRCDLYTQYAIAAACQAMEDSGVATTVAPERMGVYFGTGIGGIGTFMTEYKKLLEKGPRKVSPYFIPMMIANMASGMIAIRFGCKGRGTTCRYGLRFRKQLDWRSTARDTPRICRCDHRRRRRGSDRRGCARRLRKYAGPLAIGKSA